MISHITHRSWAAAESIPTSERLARRGAGCAAKQAGQMPWLLRSGSGSLIARARERIRGAKLGGSPLGEAHVVGAPRDTSPRRRPRRDAWRSATEGWKHLAT